ncbi:response regulator [Lentzea flava]|uniref:DNA-binding response regulator n=1 Tax=Lentzea flava TaxID=103732 RepID=A0ABQ2UAC8_9PSEU|nr:response regulator transcription factor [Lentzea flava]MCP2196648.1 two component transcriptional regulator, LuxR family [Lentzea flava]GGU16508.1 DNA-binding response regulator [Lentzea flava]
MTQVEHAALPTLRRGHDIAVLHRPATVTVVLADTQPAIRHGVRSVLERVDGVSVVGEASTSSEVLAETMRCQPDVLVIDVDTVGAGNCLLVEQITRACPETGILVFSALDCDATVLAAIRAGARGYLLKNADPDQIVRGIQAVAAGEFLIGKTIAARFGTLMHPPADQPPYPFPQLTGKEREVLDRIAAGRSNVAIAREFALASKTISNRVSSIFAKLGVADRAQAIVLARDAGLGR